MSRLHISSNSERPSRLTVIAIGIIGVSYVPLLGLHFASLWRQPQYQYFPFVLAAMAYLIWSRSSASVSEVVVHFASSRIVAAGLLVAWLVLAVATFIISPWLGALSAVILLLACSITARRAGILENPHGVCALSLLLLPLPLGFDGRLVQWLQGISSRLSSSCLDAAGVLHLMDGNVLKLVGREFFVDQACSGIVSVLSVIAAVAIFCVWMNRTLTHSAILLVMAIGLAVAMNVLRISAIAIGFAQFDADLSTGWQHETLGLLSFLLIAISVFTFDRLVGAILEPIDPSIVGCQDNPLILVFNRLVRVESSNDVLTERISATEHGRYSGFPAAKQALFVCVPFLALGLLQTSPLLFAHEQTQIGHQATAAAHGVDRHVLGNLSDAWEIQDVNRVVRTQNHSEGHYSTTFRLTLSSGARSCLLSLDYPFISGWHHLTGCYTFSGWTVLSEEVISPTDSDWKFTRVAMRDSSGAEALLYFSLFDAGGNGMSPPDGTFYRELWQRTQKVKILGASPTYFQVQLFVAAENEADVEEGLLQSLFLQSRENIRLAVVPLAANGDR